jgi:ferredoxin
MGLRPACIHAESFGGGGESGSTLPPHLPADPPVTGPLVTFARSGIDVRFGDRWNSLLELAETCDVPAEWSCRTGVCHRCENGIIAGAVSYDPEPLERPGEGSLLLCCAVPAGDITLDL